MGMLGTEFSLPLPLFFPLPLPKAIPLNPLIVEVNPRTRKTMSHTTALQLSGNLNIPEHRCHQPCFWH